MWIPYHRHPVWWNPVERLKNCVNCTINNYVNIVPIHQMQRVDDFSASDTTFFSNQHMPILA